MDEQGFENRREMSALPTSIMAPAFGRVCVISLLNNGHGSR